MTLATRLARFGLESALFECEAGTTCGPSEMFDWLWGASDTMDQDLEPIAIIDIGSNSVRLVIYDGAIRAPTPAFNEKILCGLGRTMASQGRLPEDGVARALAALGRFRALMRQHRVKNVRVIATAAVRDASNGADFIERAQAAIGHPVLILTGEREAQLAANGVRMGFMEPDGIVGDMGGGSLELIDIQGLQSGQWVTTGLGGLRLMDRAEGNLALLPALVAEELDRIPWIGAGRGRTFFPIGGTWRSLARLHMFRTGYPLHVMHGYSLPTENLISFCGQIRKSALRSNAYPGQDRVSRSRRDTVPAGAIVLEALLARMMPARVQFSVYGIREGMILELISANERKRDPLLFIARDLANRFARDPKHAEELAGWTDTLFELANVDETSEERRLRHAACLISDIGWRTHPDYRAEQSLNAVAHFGLTGIDHPGRIYLAMSIFFRHSGLGEPDEASVPARLRAILGKRLLRRARIIAGAVRFAHMLSAGMSGVLAETSLTLEDRRLVLDLPKAHADLDGERLRNRFSTLAQLLGCQGIEVRIV